eukprot:3206059-Rhodomonas_salina.1
MAGCGDGAGRGAGEPGGLVLGSCGVSRRACYSMPTASADSYARQPSGCGYQPERVLGAASPAPDTHTIMMLSRNASHPTPTPFCHSSKTSPTLFLHPSHT